MKGWIGWVLLALSLLVVFAGYRNSQPGPETESPARASACADKSCTLMSDRPSAVSTDFFRRRYQWTTSEGPVVTTCTRELVLAGTWSCKAAPGSL
jgi:hypothetical protein